MCQTKNPNVGCANNCGGDCAKKRKVRGRNSKRLRGVTHFLGDQLIADFATSPRRTLWKYVYLVVGSILLGSAFMFLLGLLESSLLENLPTYVMGAFFVPLALHLMALILRQRRARKLQPLLIIDYGNLPPAQHPGCDVVRADP